MLVVVSIIFGGAVFYVSIDRDLFAPGLYPLIVLLLPGFGGALVLFSVGCIVYWLCGIKVWAASVDDRSGSEEEVHAASGDSKSGDIRSND